MSILYVAIIRKLLHFDINSNNSHDVVSSRYVGCVGITVRGKVQIDVVKDMYHLHGTNYHGKIPMNMFRLVPQFFLLGSFDGILCKSIHLFFNNQAQTPQDHVMGKIRTLLLVLVFQKASTWRDNTSWFVENLNGSRLDKYYFVLATFSIVNLVYYNNFYYCTSFKSKVREFRLDDVKLIAMSLKIVFPLCYERSFDICFFCGIIYHLFKELKPPNIPKHVILKYGEWIQVPAPAKAYVVGTKHVQFCEQEKVVHGDPIEGHNAGQFDYVEKGKAEKVAKDVGHDSRNIFNWHPK
ncbi:hypothetical protein G4B88_001717 [Cannabis sativa]|uniref:Uncharacterized protein n=1 Tax=Cannabis sativa TaxID=3483 RepID=A0A7J6I1X8_CANSA|nr:hypothetical protein G4B88_001717 [Cannabis sativa]